MKNPLCKYCGKEMQIDWIEYTDISYMCRCDGYIKERDLESEVGKLESDLCHKKAELENHKSNSLYARSIRELKTKLREIKSLYED